MPETEVAIERAQLGRDGRTRCQDAVSDALDGRGALAAPRSAAEAGVDLAYARRMRFVLKNGRDLLVIEDIARAHDHDTAPCLHEPPSDPALFSTRETLPEFLTSHCSA